jgi:nitrogen regulatory protein P-II 2
VSEVRGFGASKAHPPRPHESTEVVPFETRTRIDVFCRGAQLIAIVETIRRVARTGHPGDGIIFVSPVTLAYRIQTGEWGESAMQPRPGAGRE